MVFIISTTEPDIIYFLNWNNNYYKYKYYKRALQLYSLIWYKKKRQCQIEKRIYYDLNIQVMIIKKTITIR